MDLKIGDVVVITNFEKNTDEWSPHYKGEVSVIDRIDYPFYYLENDNTTPFTKEQLSVISTKEIPLEIENMKYKVGDRVQIMNFDWFRNYGVNMFDTFMMKYYGEVVTIKSVHKGFYRIKEDGGQYCWIDEMFECKMEEETKSELKYKVGDKVRIKSVDWYIMNKDAGSCVHCGDKVFDNYMSVFCGSIVTVGGVCPYGYDIIEDMHCRIWTDEMIECKVGQVEEESNIDLTVKGEEAKERIEITIPEGYEYVIESGKIIFTKKKKEYPKTFEECVRVLEGENRMSLEQMNTFRKLIDARNAYWTIYGKENGLGKPWEPDWNDEKQDKYGFYDEVKYTIINPAIFVFPTEEMRDAFKENFNPDIEICKKLL